MPHKHMAVKYMILWEEGKCIYPYFLFFYLVIITIICVCVWEGGAEFSSKCFPGINEIITSSMFAPYGLNYRMLNAHNKIWINKTEV